MSQIDIHYNDLSLDSLRCARLVKYKQLWWLLTCIRVTLVYYITVVLWDLEERRYLNLQIYIYIKKTFTWLDYKKHYMCLMRNRNYIPFVSTWIHHPGFEWRSYCLLYYIVFCLRSNLVPNIASVSILLIHDWLLRLLSIVYIVTIFSREEYRFPK